MEHSNLLQPKIKFYLFILILTFFISDVAFADKNTNTIIYANTNNIEKLIELDPDNIDFLYLYALKLINENNFKLAIDTYEKIISYDATQVPAYLEAAELYYSMHQYKKAKEKFEFVYKSDVSREIKRNIRIFLKRINKLDPPILNYNFKLGYNNNINNGTYVDNVNIFKLPFKVDDSAKPIQSYEFYTNLNFQNSFTLNNKDFFYGLNFYHSDYDSDNFDRHKFKLFLKPEIKYKKKLYQLNLSFSEDNVGGIRKSNERELSLKNINNLNTDIQLGLGAGINKKSYFDNYDYNTDGKFIDLSLSLINSKNVRTFFGASLSENTANDSSYSNNVFSLIGMIDVNLPKNFSTSISSNIQATTYKDELMIWSKKRKDSLNSINISLKNEEFYIGGFVPQIEFFQAQNESNIGIYKYKTSGISMTLVSTF